MQNITNRNALIKQKLDDDEDDENDEDDEPTWLMWLWWVRIPTRDLTDVTLVSEDTDKDGEDDISYS